MLVILDCAAGKLIMFSPRTEYFVSFSCEVIYLHGMKILKKPIIYKLVKKFPALPATVKVLDHLPRIPNVTLSDFHVFRSLKEHLAGKEFANDSDL
jgi:hypothetical protein